MSSRRKWHIALFSLYSLLMLVLLFHRELPGGELPWLEEMSLHINLTPFQTIDLFVRLLDHSNPVFVRLAVVNLAGNVILFIPLGYLLPLVFPKLCRLWKTLLLAAVIIAAVEAGQMVTLLGTCDIDDWLLNLAGVLLGYGLFYILHKKPGSES